MKNKSIQAKEMSFMKFIEIAYIGHQEDEFSLFPLKELVHVIFCKGPDIINIKFNTKEYNGTSDGYHPSNLYEFIKRDHQNDIVFFISIHEF